MPVQTKMRTKSPRNGVKLRKRKTRSVSPQKSRVAQDLVINKNHSIATVQELDYDSDPGKYVQNDRSCSSILKQLHSDFNKKYISDKVTIESKLRWNRNLSNSPIRTETKSLSSTANFLKNKNSPIPSPAYSPVKPLKRSKKSTDSPSISASFETPPSSDECASPKLNSSKRKFKNLSLSVKLAEEKLLSTPIRSPKVNNTPLRKSRAKTKVAETERSSTSDTNDNDQSNDFKKIEETENKNVEENKNDEEKKNVKRSKKVLPIKKTSTKRKLKIALISPVKKHVHSEFYIDDEHLNMENVLETESEKSEVPNTTSSSLNTNGFGSDEMLSEIRSESDEKISDDKTEEDEPNFKYDKELNSKTEKMSEDKNLNEENLESLNENETEIDAEIAEINDTHYEYSTEADLTVLSEQRLSEFNKESSELNENNQISYSPDITVRNSNPILNEMYMNKEEINGEESEKTLTNDNNDAMEAENYELQNNNFENFNENQGGEGEAFLFQHHRIGSLKSPLSSDSAQGSSIDVETNYHPRHCEIFWGRKGNFPYWPCLIWPDPEGKTLRIEKLTYRQYISYHVKFFADNGQRSWIYKDNLIAYSGREDFERKAKELSAKLKPNVFKKWFTISPAKLPIWNQAIKEADRILATHIEKRAEVFENILKESVVTIRSIQKQRRLSLAIDRSSSIVFNNSTNENDSIENISKNSSSSRSSSSLGGSLSKRRRSSSVMNENDPKRHKIESDTEDLQQQKEILTTINTNSGKYMFPKDLIEVVADYTLRTTENEENFKRFENCVVELFNIVRDSFDEEFSKGPNLKKHPNRIMRKHLITRLHHRYNEILHKPFVKTNQDKIKKKKIVDVPAIEVVLKDVIDLLEDKNYLFRQKKKGPICSVCNKPNDLIKCAGYCETWMHKDCSNLTRNEYLDKLKITKIENSKKNRRSGKRLMSIGLPSVKEINLNKEDHETSFTHVTGDNEEKSLVTNDSEETETLNQSKDSQNDSSIQLDSSISSEKITCKSCQLQTKITCFICEKPDEEHNNNILEDTDLMEQEKTKKIETYISSNLIKCKINSCNKYYHIDCLSIWPQSHITQTKEVFNKVNNTYTKKIEMICPAHTCHSCVSDDPRYVPLRQNNTIQCIKCPAAYHFISKCVPAGSEFLSANYIICPRHNDENKPVNTDWCFSCSGSGNLICCDTCPSSFHLDCLKLEEAPKEKFLCELCRNGCLPLYGDLVWCKFSSFRWWPSVVIPPPIIPRNLFRKAHPRFEFCVRFLGTNDYGWTGRHRVYQYQEDDYSDRKKISDKILQKAIDEAKFACDFFEKNKPKSDIESSAPLPYKKIKTNFLVPPVKLENETELSVCECSPNSESPCGYDSQCLNRVLMIECNPKSCPAGEKCENRMFDKRQYAPVAVQKTGGKGFGLISTAPIMAGTFIIEYVGELIDDNELKKRIQEKQLEKDPHFYFFSIESNLTIDAGPKGNLARFMNHSCEPNCEPQKWTVNGIKRIGLFAKYDIKEGTELTFHYNFECIGDNKTKCHCGAENCKGYIGEIYNKKTINNTASTSGDKEKNDTEQQQQQNSSTKPKKSRKMSR